MQFNPHTYQSYCIRRIIEDKAVGLFLDMGLGKTAVTLTAINDLRYNRFAIRKALIIAPKKVAEATWEAEADKWDHLRLLRFSRVMGTAVQRVKALCTPADVYVMSRDNVDWLVGYYRQDWPFDMVVLDESSSFKNPQSKRFKALKKIRSRISRLVELTGTPAPNGMMDLWAQVYLLDGGERLGKTIGGFRERYFLPDKRNRTTIFSWKAKEEAEARIRGLIGDICISMKAEDYLSLPDCIEHDIPVKLDGPAEKAYRKLEAEMLLPVDGGEITAGSAAVLTGKLLQLCNGAVYDAENRAAEVHRCKLDAFLETVEQLHGEPALVFYAFQHDKDRLLAVLSGSGLRVRAYTGPADADAWNRGGVDILLAHPASCAYGLNLQAGGRQIIWFGLTWSLEQYQQANKRLHRQGQEKPVIVHRLVVQGGVDEDVIGALAGKGDTQAALLESLKARIDKVKEENRT